MAEDETRFEPVQNLAEQQKAKEEMILQVIEEINSAIANKAEHGLDDHQVNILATLAFELRRNNIDPEEARRKAREVYIKADVDSADIVEISK